MGETAKTAKKILMRLMEGSDLSVRYFVAAAVMAAAFCLPGCSGTVEENPLTASEIQEESTSEKLSPTPSISEADVPEEKPEPDVEDENDLSNDHVRIRLKDSGNDVFALWGSGRPDYRYGPSIMTYDSNRMDAWFAFPGDSRREYDWISYRHSDDGGKTWGDEKVVLSPTPGSLDCMSVCDPDVIYHKGYYYMGYTGTTNREGLCNNVFIARSKRPEGPYEKWDGTGWGGNPIPMIYYNGVDIGWGVGEPSFVIVGNRLFIYSTLDSFASNAWVRATRVHSADLTDPMWPSNLHFEGICVFRADGIDADGYTYADSDSWDVAYLEDRKKFVALTTNRRFKDDSCLLYYESYDGINFERVSELNTDVICGCHNCGLSSDRNGHIKKGDNVFVGYAYSGSKHNVWGVWATRFARASIDFTDEPDRSEDGLENCRQPIVIDGSLVSQEQVMLQTDQGIYTAFAGDDPIRIRYYTMNCFRRKTQIDEREIHIENYDKRMFELSDDNRLIPVREGVSNVRVEYMGLRREICVRVLNPDCDEMRIRKFYPVCSRYDVKINEPIILKVRPVAQFGDYELRDMEGYFLNFYNITFRSSDTSVCLVSDDGTLTPVTPGCAVISVEANDCKYTIEVHITQ